MALFKFNIPYLNCLFNSWKWTGYNSVIYIAAIMGVDGATDVVTQAYDAIPPEPPGLLGELFVNVDQARRAAPRRRGWSPAKELLLYVAHGMDHLSGADDHAPADYRRMRRRELSWLAGVTCHLPTTCL